MIEKKLSNATPLDDENVVLRRSDKKELANVSLSNLNEVGEKHFLNKTQITNCILEAPNGVATRSGNTVSIKNGLKVLLSNRFNADGSLNNIEYTLPNDLTFTDTLLYNASLVVFISQSTFFATEWERYIEDTIENRPSASSLGAGTWIYKSTNENIFYVKTKNGSEWEEQNLAKVAEYTKNSSGITSFTPYQPVELAKQQDIDGMWTNSEKRLLNMVSVTNTAGIHIDLSDYLPNDGHVYEVLCVAELRVPKNSAAGYRDLIVYSDLDFGAVVLAYTQVNTPPTTYGIVTQVNNFIQIVGPGRYMAYYRTSGYSAEIEVAMSVYGYRKVR